MAPYTFELLLWYFDRYFRQFRNLGQNVSLGNGTTGHITLGVTKFGLGGPVSLQNVAPTLIKHLKQLIKVLLAILQTFRQVC